MVRAGIGGIGNRAPDCVGGLRLTEGRGGEVESGGYQATLAERPAHYQRQLILTSLLSHYNLSAGLGNQPLHLDSLPIIGFEWGQNRIRQYANRQLVQFQRTLATGGQQSRVSCSV